MKVLLISATKLEHGVDSIYGIPINIIGVGKVSSCFHTSVLLQKHNPDLVINFGSCGALKNFPIGSMIEVGKVHNDIDSYNLDEYGKTPFTDIGVINFNPNSNVECFSTDYFYDKKIHGSYFKNYQDMIKTCDIVDMELYSIAFCCMKMNTKLVSIKWVSDDGDSINWKNNNDIGFKKFKEILKIKYLLNQ
tara:strand:+ start:1515 stop:2087 length:573 start_codon:yes stop_codon:yes gene_type:complete